MAGLCSPVSLGNLRPRYSTKSMSNKTNTITTTTMAMTPPIAPPTLALCWFALPVFPLSPVLGGGPKVDDDVSSEVVNTVGISEDRVSGRAVGNEVSGGSGTAVDGEMVGSGAENILGG